METMVLLMTQPFIMLDLFRFKVYGHKQPIKLFNKIHKIRQVIHLA